MNSDKNRFNIPFQTYYDHGLEMMKSVNKLNMEICQSFSKIQSAFMQQSMESFQAYSKEQAENPNKIHEIMKVNLDNYVQYCNKMNESINTASASFSNLMKEELEKMKSKN